MEPADETGHCNKDDNRNDFGVVQVVVESFLEKRSPNKFVLPIGSPSFSSGSNSSPSGGLWQKRWFTLRGDTISYYRNGVKAGEIVLHYHTNVVLTKQKV
jgi:hypothetical protein